MPVRPFANPGFTKRLAQPGTVAKPATHALCRCRRAAVIAALKPIMDDPLTLWIRNAVSEIPAAGDAASRWIEERGLPPDAGFLARLAIEELATNCIKYAYDDTSDHRIGIEVRVSGSTLCVVVLDDGRVFNPLSVPPPDVDQPLIARQPGGLGIHLLSQMSDRLEYERRDGWNRVTVRKTFGAADGGWASAG